MNPKKLPLDKVIWADALAILKQLPENCLHMAITSPPYNLDLAYDIYVDKKEYIDFRASLKEVWRETFRVLMDGGRFALNIAPTGISSFKEIHHNLVRDVKEVGFTLRTEILWYKQNMGRNTAWGSWKSPSNPHIIPSWEYVYVFHKNSPYLEGKKEDIDVTADEFKSFSDGFWNISPHSKKNGHPAPFPEELIYRLIKYYTYRGNIVLDMFAGSGTVGVVALKTERHFICIDISRHYCQMAEKRIDDVRKQEKIEVAPHGLEKYSR
ncbi:MAG: site-specific DNA-methyltransferase [Thaumarchaeota archaeon]|nr:site-specific DNA-methyltransferase [Nitrososphaerota archaeon]